MRFFLFLACLVCLASLAPAAVAQSREERAYAQAVLTVLQPLLFKSDREYCGYLARRPDGTLFATPARRGLLDLCRPLLPDGPATLIASYHTHGAFNIRADSEVPSPEDIQADMAERVDGWVATPGGRLWFIDHRAATARQVCGPACLPQDPHFLPGQVGPIAQSYSLRALHLRIQRLDH